jgi:hypothetical protein
MSTVYVRPTNGVSYGVTHTVTSGDASDAIVNFDFRQGNAFRCKLVAVVQVLNSSNVVTMPANLAITYPSDGIVRVAGTLIATSIIKVVAQRSDE